MFFTEPGYYHQSHVTQHKETVKIHIQLNKSVRWHQTSKKDEKKKKYEHKALSNFITYYWPNCISVIKPPFKTSWK